MSRLEKLVHDRGVCVGDGADPSWFVQSVGEDYIGPANYALLMCAICPVRDDCLDFAEELGWDSGVWGGMALTPRLNPEVVKQRVKDGNDPRVALRRRAVRALARSRFRLIHGRSDSRLATDRREVDLLCEAIEEDLSKGAAPYELVKAAAEAQQDAARTAVNRAAAPSR